MCIAILNNGKSISKSKLKTCWDNNDDGAGMLYIQDGVLVAEKFPNEGLQNDDNFAKFYERYNAVKSSESGDLPMLVHFRIATHGATPEYLHPFFVSDTLGLIHNGIIHGFGSADFSDTAEFAGLLSKLPGVTSCDILDNPFVNDAIHMYLETSNKLVFLDNTGEYRIFNEQMGEWIGDNWFSNDSHTKRVRYYGSTAVTSKGGDAYGIMDDWYSDNYYNKSYSTSSTKFLDEKFGCPVCDKEQYVNENAECISCWTYIEDAVDKVYDKHDQIELSKPSIISKNYGLDFDFDERYPL